MQEVNYVFEHIIFTLLYYSWSVIHILHRFFSVAVVCVGIGKIPNCVLSRLKNRRDLGIHSEMISDAVISLFKSGQVTNAKKV